MQMIVIVIYFENALIDHLDRSLGANKIFGLEARG